MVDPYKILGISKNATDDQLRAAYRAQLMKHHPDRGGVAWALDQVQSAFEQVSAERARAAREARTAQNAPRQDKLAGRDVPSGVSQATDRAEMIADNATLWREFLIAMAIIASIAILIAIWQFGFKLVFGTIVIAAFVICGLAWLACSLYAGDAKDRHQAFNVICGVVGVLLISAIAGPEYIPIIGRRMKPKPATPALQATWEEVRAVLRGQEGQTELQRKDARNRLVGRSVIWSGTVTRVADIGGNARVHVNMTPSEEPAWVMIVDLDAGQRQRALLLNIGDSIRFTGTIEESMLGRLQIKNARLKN